MNFVDHMLMSIASQEPLMQQPLMQQPLSVNAEGSNDSSHTVWPSQEYNCENTVCLQISN
jgi:hypothetical protein